MVLIALSVQQKSTRSVQAETAFKLSETAARCHAPCRSLSPSLKLRLKLGVHVLGLSSPSHSASELQRSRTASVCRLSVMNR